MGRQAYLNRLALGRSPYEAPEIDAVDPSNPVRRVSNVHADNYMQQYDARGHPVNLESKTLGRELRRAKNDILSTMGVVVSGEDRNAGSPNQQQKINQIAAENDFGLVITTLDQLFVFFGTWWTSSLTGRIQTYRNYTHAALFDVIRSERGSTGILGFYCAGIPAWAVSSSLAIARDNPLKRLFVSARDYVLSFTGDGGLSLGTRSFFGLAFSVARSSVLMLSVEAYMYSLLQSISIVPANSIPSARLLIPFGEQSLIQLPPFPTDLSIQSIGNSLAGLLTSPGVLVFLYAYYLRPELEERIYRLIRRRLPKPIVADELSIRVAFEENLIEWVVPTLGRRSEEETHRSKLSLLEDLKCELVVLRGWLLSFFGLRSRQASDTALEPSREEKIESLRNSIETLQNELEEAQLYNNIADDEPESSRAQPSGNAPAAELAQPELPDSGTDGSTQGNQADAGFGMNRVLLNEHRMVESPGEMSSDFFSEMATLGRTSAPSAASNPPDQPTEPPQGENMSTDRHDSRSNTLFSRPSSPETSPPTSPRVRASLIHQSSDIITMQLELLGNRNRTALNPTSALSHPLAGLNNDSSHSRRGSEPADRRTITEFLEALVLSQAQRQGLIPQPDTDNNVLNATVDVPNAAVAESEPPNVVQDLQAADHPTLHPIDNAPEPNNVPNILPDGVEEPYDEDTRSNPPPTTRVDHNAAPQPEEPLIRPQRPVEEPIQGQPTADHSLAHRVTLLSAYPVDSLASHLAAIISSIILCPLESLSLRSLAHSYIASHPSSVAQLPDLIPLGLWFGGYTWSDALAYSGRVVLMRGMQTALRAGAWGFLVGSTMRIGRKFCGWGKL
ncbi:hypothetical protein NUU61_002831 [Penicillium alfredii]|uniref:Uncharacterized protein n=1 Tax=Penicillium alfredii TaxID=1506179 RepID=A0A9W9FSF9_9EURO|nr:uncharacterized protein NUU61_002831 [Penicillium alfredii]KAJ5105484.1 hypothetical protein NUU61_002831 [Penicillium alfredii]